MKPYYQDDWVTIYHGDCREVLPTLPKVDLVLTDPPYGIGEANKNHESRCKLCQAGGYGRGAWDDKPVDNINQVINSGLYAIVFGGNYYLLEPKPGWLVWDKDNGDNDFADCELAWTNIPQAVRMIKYRWHGMLQEPGRNRNIRQHPTQKPLDVMKWCIGLVDKKLGYPKLAETILDPFIGSGTTLEAAKDLNRKAIGIEIEEKYCEIAANRCCQEVLDLR